MAPATDALRLSVSPGIGMVTETSQAATRSSGRPWASLPIRRASGFVVESRSGGRPPATVVATTVIPAAMRVSIDSTRTAGCESCVPALERSTFGLQGSTPSRKATCHPSAAAVRMSVPTLPGSLIPTPTAVRRACSVGDLGIGMTPTQFCGSTVVDSASITGRLTSKTSDPATAHRSARLPCSVVYTSIGTMPAARALSSSLGPSTIVRPS